MFHRRFKNRPSLCNAFIQSTRAHIRETSRTIIDVLTISTISNLYFYSSIGGFVVYCVFKY